MVPGLRAAALVSFADAPRERMISWVSIPISSVKERSAQPLERGSRAFSVV